jgi:hypothetical protein
MKKRRLATQMKKSGCLHGHLETASISYFSCMFCDLIGKGLSASHTLRVGVLQGYISYAHVLASAANSSVSMQTAVSIAQRCKHQACGNHVDQHTAEMSTLPRVCCWCAYGIW